MCLPNAIAVKLAEQTSCQQLMTLGKNNRDIADNLLVREIGQACE